LAAHPDPGGIGGDRRAANTQKAKGENYKSNGGKKKFQVALQTRSEKQGLGGCDVVGYQGVGDRMFKSSVMDML